MKKVEENERSVILIENFEKIEQDLSEIEHFKLVKSGVVSLKSDSNQNAASKANQETA